MAFSHSLVPRALSSTFPPVPSQQSLLTLGQYWDAKGTVS